jgi:hypothetical protein
MPEVPSRAVRPVSRRWLARGAAAKGAEGRDADYGPTRGLIPPADPGAVKVEAAKKCGRMLDDEDGDSPARPARRPRRGVFIEPRALVA